MYDEQTGLLLAPAPPALLHCFIYMHDALSPLDGRYQLATAGVRAIFSERSLASARVRVEIAWLRALAAQKDVPCPAISAAGSKKLDDLFEQGLTAEGFARVKEIEKDTNHDVKAVEYFLREVLEASDVAALPWIHFGLTSEDVNANAYAMMSREGAAAVAAQLGDVAALLRGQAQEWAELPLLALTHGQPATPVTLGKEIGVFIARLSKLQQQLEQARFGAKLSGATGNFAAHVVALPHADWPRIAREVTQSLGNHYLPLTSQAEPHDDIAAASAQMAHLCAVLTDLCRDIWGYISRGVFAQKTRANEVGSSAMPHKVNPIDFENAEGNAGIAAALFSHFAQKLPVSRFQRDLSDSTVLRNLGVAHGHLSLALQSTKRGLGKISANPAAMQAELNAHPEVLAEALATCLRAAGAPDAYERLKTATRGKPITLESFQALVQESCPELSPEVRERLLKLTPAHYTGLSAAVLASGLGQAEGQ